MDTFACNLIATFGGATAISRFTSAPVSTVHSWKHNGIPSSRLAHLRLIAEKVAIAVDWETGLPAKATETPPHPEVEHAAADAGLSATKSDENIRPPENRDEEGGHGAPFPPSSATSSPTAAHQQPSPDRPAYSVVEADAA